MHAGSKRPAEDSQTSEQAPAKSQKVEPPQAAAADQPPVRPDPACACRPASAPAAANNSQAGASAKRAEMEQLQQRIQNKQACGCSWGKFS